MTTETTSGPRVAETHCTDARRRAVAAVLPAPPLSPLALAHRPARRAAADRRLLHRQRRAADAWLGDLQASSATLELVVSGYATTYAVFLVIGGRLGDALGRRRAVHRRHRRVHAGLAALRPRADRRLAGGRPHPAGRSGRARGAPDALDHPGHRRRHVAGPGAGLVRRHRRHRRRRRPGVRRLAGRRPTSPAAQWRPIFLVNVPIGLVGMALAVARASPRRAPSGWLALTCAVLRCSRPPSSACSSRSPRVRHVHWPWWSWLLLASRRCGWPRSSRVERRRRAGRPRPAGADVAAGAPQHAPGAARSPRRSSPASPRSCSSTR